MAVNTKELGGETSFLTTLRARSAVGNMELDDAFSLVYCDLKESLACRTLPMRNCLPGKQYPSAKETMERLIR